MTDSRGGFATKAIHAGQDPSQWRHRAVVPPIVMSVNFHQDETFNEESYEYGRTGNPSRNCLENCLAALENGKYCSVFSSGLGVMTAITSMLKVGDHVLSGDNVYGGSATLLRKSLSRNNITVNFVDMSDIDAFVRAIKPNTKMIWFESPTNPILKIVDIKTLTAKVKSVRPDICIAIDNTFATCYFQKPLELGVDIVMYSLTKYINGHSDIIMGGAITNRDDIAKALRFSQNIMGIIPSPFDCNQVIRSLKTLELRMQQHMKNGLAVAKFLENHPFVTKVLYPLLPSHPQYNIAIKQMTGFSGMVSFYIKGDSFKFLRALKLLITAGSLGSCQSLAEMPIAISHASVPEEEKIKLGLNDKLIRLSVGLETDEDILADLDQALKASMN